MRVSLHVILGRRIILGSVVFSAYDASQFISRDLHRDAGCLTLYGISSFSVEALGNDLHPVGRRKGGPLSTAQISEHTSLTSARTLFSKYKTNTVFNVAIPSRNPFDN
jgi:hypothetical protein